MRWPPRPRNRGQTPGAPLPSPTSPAARRQVRSVQAERPATRVRGSTPRVPFTSSPPSWVWGAFGPEPLGSSDGDLAGPGVSSWRVNRWGRGPGRERSIITGLPAGPSRWVVGSVATIRKVEFRNRGGEYWRPPGLSTSSFPFPEEFAEVLPGTRRSGPGGYPRRPDPPVDHGGILPLVLPPRGARTRRRGPEVGTPGDLASLTPALPPRPSPCSRWGRGAEGQVGGQMIRSARVRTPAPLSPALSPPAGRRVRIRPSPPSAGEKVAGGRVRGARRDREVRCCVYSRTPHPRPSPRQR